jgi:GMP synthase-like glutamine amidotransferase
VKLGILEAGRNPRSLSAWGDYPAMFRKLLGEGAFDYTTYAVHAGAMPRRVGEQDGWLVTGSVAGVYDPEPWIEPLSGFLREVRGRTPLVGVCFGHQIMAQAFGGRVIKSPKGWGVGLHDYAMTAHPAWADERAGVSLVAWHQDQVVEVPPDAAVIAASDFAPFAMLAYEDGLTLSMQPHPEFEAEYAAAGIRRDRMGLSIEQTAAALRSLERPSSAAAVGGWIVNFLQGRR